MILARPLVVIDIESTGVDPVNDRILELAFVVCYPDGSRKSRCRRFNPGIPIPPEVTAIHGITDADVAGLQPFSDFAPQIVKSLQGKDIGGYNLWRLDLPMLDEEASSGLSVRVESIEDLRESHDRAVGERDRFRELLRHVRAGLQHFGSNADLRAEIVSDIRKALGEENAL